MLLYLNLDYDNSTGDIMRILLATDGSEYSESAAKFLTRIQWTPDDSITVFHAIYAVPFQHDEQFYFNTLKAIKKDIAPRIIDTALAILKPVHAEVCAEIDEFAPNQCTPDQCIIDQAQLSGMDLIVLGARGIKGVKSLLIGSVTKSVAIHSPYSVLVVKSAETSAAGPLKILFATDGSDDSRAAGAFLAAVPFHPATELTVLHVVSPRFADIPEKFLTGMDEQSKEIAVNIGALESKESEALLEQAKGKLHRRFKKVHVLSKTGDPATEILSAAESIKADLIVVGSRGLRGVKGMLGSVSRNVLAHSTCSVLIGKTRQG
jgi:nucleotide-binding universal stress UspA family protein